MNYYSRDNIRIFHLIMSFNFRGAEIFASQLAGKLAEMGYENILCSIYKLQVNDFPVSPAVTTNLLDVSQSGLFSRLKIRPSIVFRVLRALRQYKPDIIIGHGADTLKYAVLANRIYGRATILYRNIGQPSYWARNPVQRRLYKRLYRWVDAVISVCEASRSDLLDLYKIPEKKSIVIYTSRDFEKYDDNSLSRGRFEIRKELGLDKQDILLGCVGSLSSEKNQMVLLDLIRDINNLGVHLVLVGDGPDKEKLAKYAAKQRIQDRIHFTGYQTDVIPFHAASDILLLPSLSEGMPGVLIEAGMAGVPSIGYDVGGVSEVIQQGKTGYIIPSNDFNKFKYRVLSLIQDEKLRNKIGQQARLSYRVKFNLTNIAEEYDALIYKMLLEKKKRKQ